MIVHLPTVFEQTILLYDLVQWKCFRGELTISQKYYHHTHYYRTSNNLYISSSCLLSTRTFRTKHICIHTAHASSEHCPSERCLNIVTSPTHHPPDVCDKLSQLPSPTLLMNAINTPPLFQGDSVANYSSRSSSPARQSVKNADTYYITLHYDQVRLIMPHPPFEGGGGNHYTSLRSF